MLYFSTIKEKGELDMLLKVISFNIRCCDDKDGHSIAERAPRIKAVTDAYDADVMGFQEYTPAWESHVSGQFGDKYDIFNKYRTTTGWIESPPILWKKDRFECIKTGYFWLSDTPETESRGWDSLPHNRICLYVILKEKQSGESFVAMNTHYGFGDDCQVKSSALVAEYSNKISELPTFITGDFNMTPTSKGYAEIIKSFIDVNAETARDMRSTYHGYDLSVVRDEHIDYCFIKNGFKPLRQVIIDRTIDGKFPTDHFGIYSEIEM